MRTLSPREQRLVALLLLVLAIAVAWLIVIHPIVQGFAARAERRRELQLAYARDERTIGQLASISRAAAAQRRTAYQFRLAATDPASAATALKDRLTHIVADTGGQLREVEDIAAPPGIVRARLHCSVTTGQLVALLGRTLNGLPVLTVDAITVDGNKGEQAPSSGLMDASLDVSVATSASAPR